jgi:emfourin
MRVQFQSEGGVAFFPGLQKPVSIDVDALPASDADRLRQLVRAANFFDLPAHIGAPPRGAADMRTYTLTIEDGGQRHTVRVAEPITDDALQELVNALQTQVRTLRRPTP